MDRGAWRATWGSKESDPAEHTHTHTHTETEQLETEEENFLTFSALS